LQSEQTMNDIKLQDEEEKQNEKMKNIQINRYD